MRSLKMLYCLVLPSVFVVISSKAQVTSFDGTKINYQMQGESSEGFAEAVLQFLYANR